MFQWWPLLLKDQPTNLQKIIHGEDGILEKISPESQKLQHINSNYNRCHFCFALTYERYVDEAAAKGYRVIALAISDNEVEKAMRPLALFYLADAVRPEAAKTIEFMNEYGIAVKMVTGDGHEIASHVASELNLEGRIVKRAELEAEKDEVVKQFSSISGFAEVLPKNKYEIVNMARSLSTPRRESYVVAATGDGVNDVPPIKAADVGIAVANAADALKSSADIVLMSPGISVIKDAIIEARKIFSRLYNYSIYRISESFRLVVTIAVIGVVLGTYPLTPVMIILIALLNDAPIISLAYDNVVVTKAPSTIRIRRRFVMSTIFGLTGVVNSLIVLWLCYSVLQLPWPLIQTIFFLKLTIGGHLLIYVSRTEKAWWKHLPSKQVIWATALTQIIATLLCIFGIFVSAVPIPYIIAIWIWSLVWMQISEWLKRIYVGRSE